MPDTLSALLFEWRSGRGLSAAAAGRALGIEGKNPAATYLPWEVGRKAPFPTEPMVRALCAALGKAPLEVLALLDRARESAAPAREPGPPGRPRKSVPPPDK